MLKTLSLTALLLMGLAPLALWGLHSLIASSPIGIAVQGAAVALMVWARLTLGGRSFHARADPTPGGLVTTGPYRFIRHPIYTAACAFGWAGVLTNWSVLAACLGIVLGVGALTRIFCEERLVVELYPEYRQYAQSTKRMVPYLF